METQKSLQELLMLANQQSLKISEFQEQISQLQLCLQQKETQLSEATTTIETLKKQISDISVLQLQNQQLQRQIIESEYKIQSIKRDYEKEFHMSQSMWIAEKEGLQKQLKDASKISHTASSDASQLKFSVASLLLYTAAIVTIMFLLLW